MRRIDTICPSCDAIRRDCYVQADQYPACPQCGAQMEWLPSFTGHMRQDTIEGGILIAHGLCNADGSPRRYDSRSEIARECAVRNLVPWTDVYTEDRTKDARVHDDWLKSGEAQKARAERVEKRREKAARR